MNNIIVFRFHKEPLVCQNRIQLLRLFNPQMRIYGLYGGEEQQLPVFKEKLAGLLSDIYYVAGKSAYWKWKNSDQLLSLWFKEVGHELPFDRVYVLEWDMLCLHDLDALYAHIPKNCVGLSGLLPLEKIKHFWRWTSEDPYRQEWEQLMQYMQKTYDYQQQPYACIAGGACFPRQFLQDYGELTMPLLCNDEIRYALFSQVLGFQMVDTGFFQRFTPEEHRFFNVKQEIDNRHIKQELLKLNGRRVFHPYYQVFSTLLPGYTAYNIKYRVLCLLNIIPKKILGKKLFNKIKNLLKKHQLMVKKNAYKSGKT